MVNPAGDARGRASAIYHMSGVNLSDKQQLLLNSLPSAGSELVVNMGDVTMSDLAALTAKERVEFTMFSAKTESIIIRGEEKHIVMNEGRVVEMGRQGYEWVGHTHSDKTTFPSEDDYLMLGHFKQDSSLIYNVLGEYESFYQRQRS
jgi:hypothetical protein